MFYISQLQQAIPDHECFRVATLFMLFLALIAGIAAGILVLVWRGLFGKKEH